MKINNKTFGIDADTIISCSFVPFPACESPSSSFRHLEGAKIFCHPADTQPACQTQCGAAWGSLSTLDFTSHDQCSSDPPVQLRHSYSQNAKFGKFWAAAALDLTLGSIQTQMPDLTSSRISLTAARCKMRRFLLLSIASMKG